VAILLSGRDIDGDSLAYEVLASPQSGTITGTGSQLTYVPGKDFFGSDRFTFRVRDAQGASSPETTVDLRVDPVNDPPIVQAGAAQVIDLHDVARLSASATDIDSPPNTALAL